MAAALLAAAACGVATFSLLQRPAFPTIDNDTDLVLLWVAQPDGEFGHELRGVQMGAGESRIHPHTILARIRSSPAGAVAPSVWIWVEARAGLAQHRLVFEFRTLGGRGSSTDALARHWRELAARAETAPWLGGSASRRYADESHKVAPLPRDRIVNELHRIIKVRIDDLANRRRIGHIEVDYIFWPGVWRVALRSAIAIAGLALLGYTVVTALRALRLDWRNPPWCPRCGYALDPAMPRCPECGTAIRWPDPA